MVVDVVVQTGGPRFARAALDVLRVEGQVVVTEAELQIAPAAAALDAGELGAVRVVALLAAEEQVTRLGVPAPEMFRARVDLLGSVALDVGVVGQHGGLETQPLPVARQLGRVEQVMVDVRNRVRVEVLLAVDRGAVAGAEARHAVLLRLGVGLRRAVGDGGAEVQAPVGVVPARHEDRLARVGHALVAAVILVVVLDGGARLQRVDRLEEDAAREPHPLLRPLDVGADVARGGEGLRGHRTLHELEVARRVVALEREELLEVTDLDLRVAETVVADDGVLELEDAVGHVHVDLAVPVLGDLRLHGEARAADRGAVADRVVILVLAVEGGEVGLHAAVEPQFVLRVLRAEDEEAVLRLDLQRVDLHGDAVLVVLDLRRSGRSLLLRRGARCEQKCQGK